MRRLREILLVSRPVSWVNTGLPFLAAAFEVERGLSPLLVLGTLYFLGPYNLLLYGINDIFDYESDVRNPRKRSLEGGLVAPSAARGTWLAIALTNIPFVVALALGAGPAAAVAIILTVLIAVVYSAPPVRTKERPFLDSVTSALHFVLPAVCGFLIAGRSPDALPWAVLAAFMAWGMASHALGAIQDITADREAGIASIATALGARATAAVAALGYGVAVVLAATLGPLGLLAAAALALYLLLPIMVLAGPVEQLAARRAWTGFLGLNYLVGFVLTQALLRHWGVTRFEPWDLAIAAALGATLLVLASVVATRLTTRRSMSHADAPLPTVTVIVPCRDEAAALPDVIAALRRQTHPGLDLLVVDDGSTDGSPTVARDALEGAGRVVIAPPKPDGWAGKSWACHVGARAATGELVFFVDADTILEPGAVTSFARGLVVGRYGLVSGVTRYAMPTRTERALIPGFALLLFGFVPVWWSALTGGRPAPLAFAYGPTMLVRRTTYLETGGHAAARGSATEDLDLARTIARAGHRVGTIHAADLGATRHYPDAAAVVAAWRRIIAPYAGGSLALAIGAILGQALAFVVPLALPLAAIATGRSDPAALGAATLPLAVLVVGRVVLAVTQRQPLATILWHPVTVVVTIAAQLAGIADHVLGRPPRWRGRDLPVAAEPIGGAR